jgi:hypothetical protein
VRSRQTPLQLVSPAPHDTTHTPALHTCPRRTRVPQAPQLARSVWRSRHTPPQLVRPHAARHHAGARRSTPAPRGSALPQAPQLRGRSAGRGRRRCSWSARVARHHAHARSTPGRRRTRVPQAPQLRRSVCRSRQDARAVGEAGAARHHARPAGADLARGAGVPQAPQLSRSSVRSRQAPLQLVCPPPHDTTQAPRSTPAPRRTRCRRRRSGRGRSAGRGRRRAVGEPVAARDHAAPRSRPAPRRRRCRRRRSWLRSVWRSRQAPAQFGLPARRQDTAQAAPSTPAPRGRRCRRRRSGRGRLARSRQTPPQLVSPCGARHARRPRGAHLARGAGGAAGAAVGAVVLQVAAEPPQLVVPRRRRSAQVPVGADLPWRRRGRRRRSGRGRSAGRGTTPPQLGLAARHETTHAPRSQMRPLGHTLPQAPQLLRSVWGRRSSARAPPSRPPSSPRVQVWRLDAQVRGTPVGAHLPRGAHVAAGAAVLAVGAGAHAEAAVAERLRAGTALHARAVDAHVPRGARVAAGAAVLRAALGVDARPATGRNPRLNQCFKRI